MPAYSLGATDSLVDQNDVGFDVILLAGQSNCVGYGNTNNQYLDIEDERIWQYCNYGASFPLEGATTTATWSSGATTITVASATGIAAGHGVYGTNIAFGTTVRSINGTTVTLSTATTGSGSSTGVTIAPYFGKVIKAREPLEHFRKGASNQVGPGLAFARLYTHTLRNNRRVLLVPTAWGSTGFADNNWNFGNLYYNALAQRSIGEKMFYDGYLNAIDNIAGKAPGSVTGIKANGAVTIGVRVSWLAQYQVQFNLRWRVVGSSTWNTVSALSGTSYLVPANENSTVEVQVQAYRTLEIGPWSTSVTATSTPTLLSGLLFRMTPDEIVTETSNGAFPTPATTGATYVSRWTDRSGAGRHFETVFHGSISTATTITTTSGSKSATVASATNLFVGSAVYATSVPHGTTVTAINGTTLTLSVNATATGSGVSAEFFNPLTRNHSTTITQTVGFGRPRYAVVDGIPTVALSNEWKSLWNKQGIVGNNSYSKTWLMKHVAINTLSGQPNIVNDGGTIAIDVGSRNYTSCYVNTVSTGAQSTLTWKPGTARLTFSHNSINVNASDNRDMPSAVWLIYTCTFDRSTGEMKLYRNGALVSTFTNTSALTSFAMYLGAIDLGPMRAGADGACFAEVITHSRVLSSDDAQTLCDYMRAKYNVVLG